MMTGPPFCDIRILYASPTSAVLRLFDHPREKPRKGRFSSERLSFVITFSGPDIFIHFDSDGVAVGVEILFYDDFLTDEEVERHDQDEEAFLRMSKEEQEEWFERTVPENRFFKVVDSGAETGVAELRLHEHPEMSGASCVESLLPLRSIIEYRGPEIVLQMNDDQRVIGIKVYRSPST
jgi:hypothetical protein